MGTSSHAVLQLTSADTMKVTQLAPTNARLTAPRLVVPAMMEQLLPSPAVTVQTSVLTVMLLHTSASVEVPVLRKAKTAIILVIPHPPSSPAVTQKLSVHSHKM